MQQHVYGFLLCVIHKVVEDGALDRPGTILELCGVCMCEGWRVEGGELDERGNMPVLSP